MKVLKRNLKKGYVKVLLDDEEDAWYLSHIIEEGDWVSGLTERKIKIGPEDSNKVVRKVVKLKIEAEKVEYTPSTNTLRVLGRIREGPDDVNQASYHSFNLKVDSKVTISKPEWPNYKVRKLEEAIKPQGLVLMVLLEREKAYFGILKKRGYQTLTKISGDVQKKDLENDITGNFYEDVKNKLVAYNKRYKPTKIIVASPAFWKEYLYKILPDDIKEKSLQATISTVEETAFNELIKRPEVQTALRDDRTRFELEKVEAVMLAIKKEKACYGLKECEEKMKIGAIAELMVSDEFMKEMKEKGKYRKADWLLRKVEEMQGSITMITKKDAKRKLKGLGGIAGILRWTTTQNN